ncbi:MAG: sulfite exporter TauE/SafE family protein [Candidatus Staskawiczbacteria bacterium]|nr:sulfite exporter TauE/SafE family protein [Candidatus Staskawiczbacteria bacterium]
MKKIFKITGMHCNSCSQLIEKSLENKVNSVSASYAKGKAEIDFDEGKISEAEIKEVIKKAGYEATEATNKKNGLNIWGWIAIILIALLIVYALFVGFDFNVSGFQLPKAGESANLLILFVVGLLTGFHCISMCGGFIVSYTTKNALKGHKGFSQHLVYGASKTLSYAVIGGTLGLIGGFIAFSTQLRGIIAVLAGIFMVFYALSMFGFSWFRRFQLNPKFLSKFSAEASKKAKGAYFAPMITGLLTGLFIACGPLQAMYLYAIGSGSFRVGAISLAVFGLGTLPVLIGFGSLVSVISHKTTSKILKVSAVLVFILGFIMINTGLALTGSSWDLQSIETRIFGAGSGTSANIVNGYQEINMTIDGNNWSPKVFVLKKGIPVKWNINAIKLPCATQIYVNDYNLDIKLKTGMNTIEFTPDKVGTIKWACWMGMISGNFVITDNGNATTEQINSATPTCTGMCHN